VRSGLALVLLLLSSCAPEAETQRVFLVPDCNLGFEAQSELLTAQAGLAPPVKEPGEPYSFHNAQDGSVSYVITEASAPAHPAILMQRAGGGRTTTSGCPYGDKGDYEALKTYIESLKPGGRS
jgi:hypothetical protein